MKKTIVAIILGLAFGYSLGFTDATEGRESIGHRAMDKFGITGMKASQAERVRKAGQLNKD